MRLLFPPVSIALLSSLQMQNKQTADETAALTKRLQDRKLSFSAFDDISPNVVPGCSPSRPTDSFTSPVEQSRIAVEDVDRDDRIGLVVHVPTAELGLDRNSTSLTLVRETFDRKRFIGTDAVQIVPPKFGVRQ